jgi:hypothetical protein
MLIKIGNTELVVSYISIKALKVTDIIASLIVLTVKIKKKRERPPKVTFNTKKPVVTTKQYKRLKKDIISISYPKSSKKCK